MPANDSPAPLPSDPPVGKDSRFEEPPKHKHRCMRCDGEFECYTPGICKAQYDVLPNIVILENGQPKVIEHCPPNRQNKPPQDGVASKSSPCPQSVRLRYEGTGELEATSSTAPVGKDSRFEELSILLDTLRPHLYECDCAFCANWKGVSGALAKQREEIGTLTKRLTNSMLEATALRGFKHESERLEAELERQRETTLTPEEARMIDDALDGTNGQVWAQVVAKLRRIASSSPLT